MSEQRRSVSRSTTRYFWRLLKWLWKDIVLTHKQSDIFAQTILIDQTPTRQRFRIAQFDQSAFRATMNLLHGIPPEVYNAYFKYSGTGIGARPLEKVEGALVCAEDPFWEDSDVPRLSELAVRTLAK